MTQGAAADEPRSLRVDVRCGKEVLRPTVGLKCAQHWTMADVLVRAMSFQDRRQRTEAEIFELMQLPYDITLKDKNSAGVCCVGKDETVAGAALFGEYAHVSFDIAVPQVRSLWIPRTREREEREKRERREIEERE